MGKAAGDFSGRSFLLCGLIWMGEARTGLRGSL